VATQQTKLEASRSEWGDLASALRTPAIRSRSGGIWDAEHRVVELVVQKGSHFKGTGWHDKQRGVRPPSRPAPPIVLGHTGVTCTFKYVAVRTMKNSARGGRYRSRVAPSAPRGLVELEYPFQSHPNSKMGR
jgi:hypothetical protein